MLYRKYRPQTFDQVVGQEHVVRTLKGALESGRVGHAYLFTGSRGTGKTTMARIFAKALNCLNYNRQGITNKDRVKEPLPCNKCDFCRAINEGRSLDLIEIDAASNRGIDEIRNLKESALVAAPGGGYKVFIVDEVHMLTKDAFNALLKILEEPPSHVVFILATTEVHKILPTVLSRVQRFDFKRLNNQQIISKLKSIAKSEEININDEALYAIAVSADGALRDAEVSLSKVRVLANSSQLIGENEVNEALGLISLRYYPEFLGYLASNDGRGAVSFIQKAVDSGIDLEHFTGNLLDYMRRVLVAKINPATLVAIHGPSDDDMKKISTFASSIDSRKLVKMLSLFSSARNEIKFSPVPQLPLELAIFECISEKQ